MSKIYKDNVWIGKAADVNVIQQSFLYGPRIAFAQNYQSGSFVVKKKCLKYWRNLLKQTYISRQSYNPEPYFFY